MLLQYADSGLVGVGRVVVSAHTFLECKGLVKSTLGVWVVFLAFVVENKTALPQCGAGLNTLELVRLLSFVAQNGQLVAANVTLFLKSSINMSCMKLAST